MSGLNKRCANVSREAAIVGDSVSKASLLEAAWHLASLAADGGCDDPASTLERLLFELDLGPDGKKARRALAKYATNQRT